MKNFDLKINGNLLRGFAEKLGTQLWIHVNGKTLMIETSSQKNRKSKLKQSSSSPEILAPMPGKITSIKKNIGDLVQAGDVVLVMEAMKMEYSLKSQVDGVVEKIQCKQNQQVVLGDMLAYIGSKK